MQHPHGHGSPRGCKWLQPPLSRYKQLWQQLLISDGIVCRQYALTPHLPAVTVSLIPVSQRLTLLKQHHDSPSSGHLGFEKTAAKIRQVGYWVGML